MGAGALGLLPKESGAPHLQAARWVAGLILLACKIPLKASEGTYRWGQTLEALLELSSPLQAHRAVGLGWERGRGRRPRGACRDARGLAGGTDQS